MDSTELISVWNAAAKHKVKESLALAVEYEISRLDPPVDDRDLLTAVENYRAALALNDSQAYHHTLLQWLRRNHYRNYLPGYFNIENYKKTNFTGRKQGTAAELLND